MVFTKKGFNQADVQYIIEYILRKVRVRGIKRTTSQVLNIIQKVPETVIHLKVDEDRAVKGRWAENACIPVKSTTTR